MPNRAQYAKLFKFTKTNQNIRVNEQLSLIAKQLQLPADLLVFMIQVFQEAGLISIEDGVMNATPRPAKADLANVPVSQERKEQITMEQQLLGSNSAELIKLINSLGQ